MESLYILLGSCMFIFVLFCLYEIVKLKKEVYKISGITDFLIKNHSSKKNKNSK